MRVIKLQDLLEESFTRLYRLKVTGGTGVSKTNKEKIQIFTFDKLKYYNYKDVIKATEKINKIKEEKNLLNNKISKIKSNYHNFLINRYI